MLGIVWLSLEHQRTPRQKLHPTRDHTNDVSGIQLNGILRVVKTSLSEFRINQSEMNAPSFPRP